MVEILYPHDPDVAPFWGRPDEPDNRSRHLWYLTRAYWELPVEQRRHAVQSDKQHSGTQP